ncbi:MAG: UDP-N-acetylmuramate dehydrogenase [Wujia sp.]
MDCNIRDICIIEQEAMKKHTTFRIGGPARLFAMPKNVEEIKQLLQYCEYNRIRYMILGNGSNVLFSDDGFDGMVIQIGSAMGEIQIIEDRLYVGAGAILSKVAKLAYENGLSGMEFAAGIPGSVGGAIVMNAGAYGGEMKDIVEYVDILEKNGSVRRYANEEMDFAYRHSIVDEGKIVVGVGLHLSLGDKNMILEKMQQFAEARRSKQPLEYGSAGSTFKRPEGYFAGKLIDDCGLRGYRVGGAMVSEKHCGFVINYEQATCEDVLTLMEDVRAAVKEKYGVTLEPEVRIIR